MKKTSYFQSLIGAALISFAGCEDATARPHILEVSESEESPDSDFVADEGGTFCLSAEDTIQRGDSERSRAIYKFVEELRHCAQRTFNDPPLNAAQESALNAVFQSFANSSCAGCHIGSKSYGALGGFVANKQAGSEEFFQGLAQRHYRTHQYIEACVAPGPAKERLLSELRRWRHRSEAGHTYRVNGQQFATVADIPFFRPGSTRELYSQALSFLRGAFENTEEVAPEVKSSLHKFLAMGDPSPGGPGARLPVKAHICVVDAALVAMPYDQWQGLEVISHPSR